MHLMCPCTTLSVHLSISQFDCQIDEEASWYPRVLTFLFPGCLRQGFQTVKNILENMCNILQPPVAKSRRNTDLDFSIASS